MVRGWRAGPEEGGEGDALDEVRDGLLHVVQQLAAVGVRARVRVLVARLEALDELGAVANRLIALVTQDGALLLRQERRRLTELGQGPVGELEGDDRGRGRHGGGSWKRRVERGVRVTRCATTKSMAPFVTFGRSR